MIRRLGLLLAVVVAGLPSYAQTPTLAKELREAGVPEGQFSRAELDQGVDATYASHGDLKYLVYMRLDTQSRFVGLPQLVRFDTKTGVVLRKELRAGDVERCCGSPGDINFTQDYLLLDFHDTPSASTVLAVDKELKAVEEIFGFDMREIAPNVVVFIENMIHFASAHAERLSIVDLRTADAHELYPPKGDPLRVAFAHEHEKHMPSDQVCQQMNDPCDPDFYDEDIQFLSANVNRHFAFRVDRNAEHAMPKEVEPDAALSESAVYVYENRGGRWFYCERKISGTEEQNSNCQPELPVVPEGEPMYPSPFVAKVK